LQRKNSDSRATENGVFMWDEAAGYPVVSLSGAFRQVPVFTSAPASATATGTAGQMAWDSSYIYICTATDTWTRAALSTW
jgi:hypothetical protein